MSKKISLLFLLSLIIATVHPAMAIKYSEALNASQPMALLIYADWADGLTGVSQTFNILSQRYENTYNFVRLNIADPETKVFNQKYHIYPNLPYVLLYKDGGKISRYLPKDCASDLSCFSGKLDMFNN